MKNNGLTPVTIELDEDVAEVVYRMKREAEVTIEELVMRALDGVVANGLLQVIRSWCMGMERRNCG